MRKLILRIETKRYCSKPDHALAAWSGIIPHEVWDATRRGIIPHEVWDATRRGMKT